MNTDTDKVNRRRRRTPARRMVPAIVEERERKPIIFGWGADLTPRERESLKEKIALFAGIILAVVIAGLLGWGVLYDNVIHPNQISSANAKPIAIIGTKNPYVITMGFFKTFQKYQNSSNTSNIQQVQSQLLQYEADPKKNAAVIQQLNSQLQSLQQAQDSLPTTVLNTLTEDQVLIQRSSSVGIKVTPKLEQDAYNNLVKQMGGPRTVEKFITSTGMTRDQVLMINLGDYLRGKVQAKVQSQVKPKQTKVRASHILICYKGTSGCTNKTRTKKQAKALADQLLAKAKHGANFAALAKKYSSDTVSAKKGGDLNYFTKTAMVAPFAKVAFKLKPGQFGIALSQFGYHVIKVTGRKVVKLTATELQQQQQQAYPTWVSTQQAKLHVQNIVSTSALPNLATPVPTIAPVVVPTSPAITLPTVTTKTTPATGATQGTSPKTKSPKK